MNDPLGLFENDDKDPLGLFTEAPKTSWKDDLKIGYAGVGNTVDRAASGLVGGLASLFSDDAAGSVFDAMKERVKSRNEFANPEGLEQGVGGKVVSTLGSLPSQVLSAPLSMFSTGQDLIDNGESLKTAQAGQAIDIVGNALGMAIPGGAGATLGKRVLSGAAINAAQDAAVKKAISSISETEASQKQFDPTWEDAGVAAIVGGGFGAATRPKAPVKQLDLPKQDPLGLFETTKPVEGPQMSLPFEQRGLFDEGPSQAPLKALEELPSRGPDWADNSRQQELKFPSVEDIAREDSLRSGQRDMFSENYAPNEQIRDRGLQLELPFEQRALFPEGEAPLTPREMPTNKQELAGNNRQLELKFPTPEDIARQAALESPQHDMFAGNYDANRGAREQMMREAAAKQEMERAPMQQQDPAIRQAQMEEAYKQREAQRLEDIKAAREDRLMELQEQLRARPERKRGNFVPKGQRGALNIEAISDGFRALLDGKPVGKLISNLTPEQSKMLGENASVDIAKVDPEVRGTGVGKALYEAWAQAHEGRIEPSGKTSPDAWRVWKKYYPEKLDAFVAQEARRIKEGADPYMVIGNITDPAIAQRVLYESRGNMKVPQSQRGAINFTAITESLKKLAGRASENSSVPVKTILGKDNIPLGPEPSKIVADALTEGRDTNAYNWTRNTASGSILEGKTRNSALVKGVSDTVTAALKRADMFTKKVIDPVKAQFRKLSTDKIETIGQALKWEMQEGRLLTAEELQKSGMDTKMLKAYADMRDMFKETYKIQNEARVRQGLEPITEVEHYLASRWSGDFRQPVYNKEGKLVWYLADHTKWGLIKQAKALLKKDPSLVVKADKAHKVSNNLAPNQLQAAYTTMLDTLGRNDPAVLKLREAYEASLETEGRAAFGQEQHFKDKANIRGFVGDRPGKASGKEALAMFDQQFKYAKNAATWASLQEAGAKLKEVFSDEKLAEQQPKNMAYVKDYWKDVLGQGTSQWAQATENLVRDLGISPTTIKKAVGSSKAYFITQKIAVNTGYVLTNVLQVFNTIPHLMDTMVKAGGNPVKSLAVGLLEGSYAALGHATEKAGVELPASKFHKEALKYAEDNGVISQSALDEGSLGERGVVNGSVKALGTTISAPEVFVRSVAYMTYVDMLKSTGKLADADVFKRAEDLVNTSMVDYRKHERPLAFSKLGIVGDALNTLQTYPANMINQYRYFGKEAVKGNVLPLVSMLMLQGYLAGAMGIPGFSDLDKLWGFVKTKLPDSAWEKVKDFDPKLWMLENMGEFGGAGAYGSLSDATGVALTSRVAAPVGSEMISAPGGPIADIFGQVGTAASALVDPMNTTKRAQALHDIAPAGLQGWLETGPMKDSFSVQRGDGSSVYSKPSDLQDRQGKYVRTPFEEKIRAAGLRSQKEAVTSDVVYKQQSMLKESEKRSKDIVDKFYDAVRRGDEKRAEELHSLYVRLNGRGISDKTIETNMVNEYTTALEKQSLSAKEKIGAVTGLARTRKILEKYENQP